MKIFQIYIYALALNLAGISKIGFATDDKCDLFEGVGSAKAKGTKPLPKPTPEEVATAKARIERNKKELAKWNPEQIKKLEGAAEAKTKLEKSKQALEAEQEQIHRSLEPRNTLRKELEMRVGEFAAKNVTASVEGKLISDRLSLAIQRGEDLGVVKAELAQTLKRMELTQMAKSNPKLIQFAKERGLDPAAISSWPQGTEDAFRKWASTSDDIGISPDEIARYASRGEPLSYTQANKLLSDKRANLTKAISESKKAADQAKKSAELAEMNVANMKTRGNEQKALEYEAQAASLRQEAAKQEGIYESSRALQEKIKDLTGMQLTRLASAATESLPASQVEDLLRPYDDFVRAESSRINRLQTAFASQEARLGAIDGELDSISNQLNSPDFINLRLEAEAMTRMRNEMNRDLQRLRAAGE